MERVSFQNRHELDRTTAGEEPNGKATHPSTSHSRAKFIRPAMIYPQTGSRSKTATIEARNTAENRMRESSSSFLVCIESYLPAAGMISFRDRHSDVLIGDLPFHLQVVDPFRDFPVHNIAIKLCGL